MLSGQGTRSFTLDRIIDNPGQVMIVGARLAGGERSLAARSLLLNLLRLKVLARFGQSGHPML
jgi:hypothetical protein